MKKGKNKKEQEELHFVQNSQERTSCSSAQRFGLSFPNFLESREVAGAVYSWNAQTRRVTFRVFTRVRRRASPSAALSLRGTSTRRAVPADENRNGNVGSSRIASRRVASRRAVAWCCVALCVASSGRSQTASVSIFLFLFYSLLLFPNTAIPSTRFHSRPHHSAYSGISPLRCHVRWKRTDRTGSLELRVTKKGSLLRREEGRPAHSAPKAHR